MASFQFSYTLTQQEVYDGLRLSGVYKQSGKRAIIESVLLGVFFLFFLVSFLLEWDAFDLGMTLVAGVVILVLNLVPRLDMKRKAKQGLRDVKLRLYAKKAYIDTKAGSQSIDLDGSAAIKAVKGKEGQLVEQPIEMDFLVDVGFVGFFLNNTQLFLFHFVFLPEFWA